MRQKHGQNFLTDLNIANKIVGAAQLSPNDSVVEIGPGKGVLTKLIQPLVNSLTAVEIDKILAGQLKNYYAFHNINNVEIINEDFLKLIQIKTGEACCELSQIKTGAACVKFISNLPYNVGTAIIQKILPLPNWTTAVFMLQKEVIQRLAATPGAKEYGYISIFTQFYAQPQILFDVSPKCFTPAPKVMSSVIKLTKLNSAKPDERFFPFIKHAFSMRRKTILNSLSSFLNIEKSAAAEILQACKTDPQIRPEKLTLSDFKNICSNLPS
jgi:16S rRNA (adenine1518-N6/adenine1519-N6)-dimethyltransferase